MIDIDGSHGEGGGQVLRTALALSALTRQATHIHHIRANRPVPGLAPQHLAGVRALARVCDADVEGADLRSTALRFRPRAPCRPGVYSVDVAAAAGGGSAGAVTLILQALLMPLVFAPGESRLTLMGGTHVAWSPSFDYLDQVYLPTLAAMGVHCHIGLEAWGFYPVGGGRVTATVEGKNHALAPLRLEERGDPVEVRGTAVACNLPAHIAQRMANRATNLLAAAGLPVDSTPRGERGAGPGAGLFLVVEYPDALAGFSALGARGKPSEQVADEACRELLAHHAAGAAVDPHLADQLLLPMALAGGRSIFQTSRITAHLQTNAHIIRHFLPTVIAIEGEEGEAGWVSVCPASPA